MSGEDPFLPRYKCTVLCTVCIPRLGPVAGCAVASSRRWKWRNKRPPGVIARYGPCTSRRRDELVYIRRKFVRLSRARCLERATSAQAPEPGAGFTR